MLPAGTVTWPASTRRSSAPFRKLQGTFHELQETRERADITYLANKTGWDARAVALAALADQFSRIRGRGRAADGIRPSTTRCSAPACQPTQTRSIRSSHTVQRVWKEALAQGVIPKKLEEKFPGGGRLCRSQCRQATRCRGARSGIIAQRTAGGGTGEAGAAAAVPNLYVENRTDLAKFWDTVSETLGRRSPTTPGERQARAAHAQQRSVDAAAAEAVGGDAGLTDPVHSPRRGCSGLRLAELLAAETPIPEKIPGDTSEMGRRTMPSISRRRCV